MDFETKLSIIIYINNDYEHISKCLDSITNQSMRNIEIICINDSSSDESLKILDNFSKKDKRVKVINNNNYEGIINSYNQAIKCSEGDYISFINSRDWIDNQFYEKLYENSINKNLDINMCCVSKVNNETGLLNYNDPYFNCKCIKKFNNKVFSYKDIQNFIGDICTLSFNKIYKKSFLIENDIVFQKNFYYAEIFFYETFLLADKVSFLDENLYYHRTNNMSSSLNCVDDIFIAIHLIENKITFINQIEGYELLLNKFLNRIFNNILKWEDDSELLFNKTKEYLLNNKAKVEKLKSVYLSSKIDTLLSSKDFEEFKEKERNLIKISVIIPVFNSEQTINKCLNSLFNQTLKEIEIIFIDDGSTDNSSKILFDYASKYDFIKIISQKNQGPGIARNKGIKKAKGEYIAFLDSDDYYVEDYALEYMFNMAIEKNIKMCSANLRIFNNYLGFYKQTETNENYEINFIEPNEYGIPWFFYKNIYQRKILLDNNILFPDLLRGQDPVFLSKVFKLIDKILTVPIILYAYESVPIKKLDTNRKIVDYGEHFKQVFDILKSPEFDSINEKYHIKYDNFKKTYKI